VSTDVLAVLYLIVPAVLVAWTFKRLGLVEIVGFVLGGILSYYLLERLGVAVEGVVEYAEPIRLIGLILFSFEVGASLDIRGVTKSAHVVLSAELVFLIVAWITSGVLVTLLELSVLERLLVFLVIVNSSTLAVVALRKSGLRGDVYERAALQTSLEDLLQFVILGLLVTAPQVQRLNAIQALLDALRLAGSVLALFLAARYLSMLLSKSPFTRGRAEKFFTLVVLAMLFSTFAFSLGLPELIGAFIAGLAASLYFDLSDVKDMLSGVRELGLLFYFTTLGLVIAPWMPRVDFTLFAHAAVFALVAIATRVVGIALGLAVSGMDVRSSVHTSLILAPISETGMIFAYALAERGFIGVNLVILVTFSVLFTMVISSAITPKSSNIATRIEALLPRRMIKAINAISRVYYGRVEFSLNALSALIRFSALSLIITTVTSVTLEALMHFNAPTLVPTLVMITSLVLILLVHVATLRKLTKIMLSSISGLKRATPLIVLNTVVDFLMCMLAVALQIYLLYDYIYRHQPLLLVQEYAVVYISTMIVATITIYETVRRYKQVVKPS